MRGMKYSQFQVAPKASLVWKKEKRFLNTSPILSPRRPPLLQLHMQGDGTSTVPYSKTLPCFAPHLAWLWANPHSPMHTVKDTASASRNILSWSGLTYSIKITGPRGVKHFPKIMQTINGFRVAGIVFEVGLSLCILKWTNSQKREKQAVPITLFHRCWQRPWQGCLEKVVSSTSCLALDPGLWLSIMVQQYRARPDLAPVRLSAEQGITLGWKSNPLLANSHTRNGKKYGNPYAGFAPQAIHKGQGPCMAGGWERIVRGGWERITQGSDSW